MEVVGGSKGNRKVIQNCVLQETDFKVSVWNKNADKKILTSQTCNVTDRNYFVSHVCHPASYPVGRGGSLRTQTERRVRAKRRLQQEWVWKYDEFYLNSPIGFHIVVWTDLSFIFLVELYGDWLVTVKWHSNLCLHDFYVKCPTHGSIPDLMKSVMVISKIIWERLRRCTETNMTWVSEKTSVRWKSYFWRLVILIRKLRQTSV
jgi:hypothetical protein